MRLSRVRPGMDCVGETVVQGTTITSFAVHVIDIVQDTSEGPRILISVSGPAVDRTGVAEGFSGSPVLCDAGTGTPQTIGAVSETIGDYGNKVALVTPIEQMLGEPVAPPSGAPRLSIRGRPLLGPLMVGGLSPALATLVVRAGQRAGRTVLATPASAAIDFPAQSLVPGASVSTMYATGGITLGAVGTVTYRDGNLVYAFGHPLDAVGRRSLILGDAYVYYVVNNPDGVSATSYKLAAPGHVLGTLTSDTPNAVIGGVGAGPRTVPVDVSAHDLDTNRRLALHTEVADETGIGNPSGSSLLSTVAPVAIAQAATAIYNGTPAAETGRMCLAVSLRETRAPLRFCNRYVSSPTPGATGSLPPILALLSSTDATGAFALLDAESFAQLHVTHVAVALDAERGMKRATIVSAHAPRDVRAGRLVRVRLTVRRYRAGLLTISIRVRIPARAHGRLVARIAAAGSLTSADALASALISALFGGSGVNSGGSAGDVKTIRALRRQFAGVGHYDGLVVRFGRRRSRHAFRDPRLLVGGNVKLVFRVSK